MPLYNVKKHFFFFFFPAFSIFIVAVPFGCMFFGRKSRSLLVRLALPVIFLIFLLLIAGGDCSPAPSSSIKALKERSLPSPSKRAYIPQSNGGEFVMKNTVKGGASKTGLRHAIFPLYGADITKFALIAGIKLFVVFVCKFVRHL